MIADLLSRPCVVETPGVGTGESDDYGVPIDTDTQRVSTVCEIQQSAAAETRAGGLVDRQSWNVFLPAGTVVTASSRVVLDDGRVFAVDGGAYDVRHPRTGVVSHVEVAARLVQ